ncbi:hypothetical protein D9V60_00480 [Buchnera aphidicola (Aphis craccivora)]|uniref:Uncharacterized protein n=1 Tax=Buchnera aphidicola (Aphis craccivora) TaxID=466616 RepID=A0A4D6XL16_9GAMM|nr:hypothetical protein [Buchnera aphidicola]QCI16359.1 hypothetical protein D9V60_00480 [Buchnera aphidicola (Aphis craccivora)]QLL40502.1 hypothetical protein F3C69_00480 [Buchnera aphidicola (Aphis craccivore)]WAI17872.1 MAG: hypothetical protein OWM53_00485 [Buchnera aphidicola (Aphis craccivora)]
MLNFNKNTFFFQKKVIILKFFIILSVTSCHLNILQKNHNILFNKNNQNQLKKLIIPEEINVPTEDQEYKIPYTEEDLQKEKIDIFPPV